MVLAECLSGLMQALGNLNAFNGGDSYEISPRTWTYEPLRGPFDIQNHRLLERSRRESVTLEECLVWKSLSDRQMFLSRCLRSLLAKFISLRLMLTEKEGRRCNGERMSPYVKANKESRPNFLWVNQSLDVAFRLEGKIFGIWLRNWPIKIRKKKVFFSQILRINIYFLWGTVSDWKIWLRF